MIGIIKEEYNFEEVKTEQLKKSMNLPAIQRNLEENSNFVEKLLQRDSF